MNGGDRGLQLIGTGLPATQCLVYKAQSVLNFVLVPQSAVLLLERDQLAAAVDAGVAARVLKEHQRKQALILRLVRHQLAKDARQPNGLGAEITANELLPRSRRVSFIEDQVEDRLHGSEAFGQYLRRRNFVGDARVLDLAFGAHQALRERRFGNDEGAGDLRSGEAAEGAQRERHLRLLING